MELSLLIPARNEMFLARTIEDALLHSEAETEILVGLDGAWAEPVIHDHPRVTIVHVSESIGQRAMTNQLARLARGKYVMKVDAHCAFKQGFDKSMLEAFERAGPCVMVPMMRNLHAFDWVCADGHRRYQSPSGPCTECGKSTERDVVWIPKERPESRSYCFDSSPHFQYFNDWTRRAAFKEQGDLTETMSIQGSCFMLTLEDYWRLNICDESFGSWGSQGIEVACKAWLSGMRVLCNHRTWYAHLFRTQGGDFGFPYALREGDVQAAKKRARELFYNQTWPGQQRPLSWLLERFWPVKGWTDEDLQKLKEH